MTRNWLLLYVEVRFSAPYSCHGLLSYVNDVHNYHEELEDLKVLACLLSRCHLLFRHEWIHRELLLVLSNGFWKRLSQILSSVAQRKLSIHDCKVTVLILSLQTRSSFPWRKLFDNILRVFPCLGNISVEVSRHHNIFDSKSNGPMVSTSPPCYHSSNLLRMTSSCS